METGIPVRRSLAAVHRSRKEFGVFLGVLALAGCGDGGGDAPAVAAAVPSAPAVANSAPTIAGEPPASIAAGSAYAFLPIAGDADGDILTFGIEGRPAWATFDTTTGALGGTPAQTDVGASAPIVISATDGEASAVLASFTIDVVGAESESVPLTWMPPTENEDGSPLRDLSGYKLYWGTEEGAYPNSVTIDNPGVTRYVIENLTPATWHFVMTALTSQGLESEHSNLATQEVL
jgi:hypothetical protein